jgi:hypothetical protein
MIPSDDQIYTSASMHSGKRNNLIMQRREFRKDFSSGSFVKKRLQIEGERRAGG